MNHNENYLETLKKVHYCPICGSDNLSSLGQHIGGNSFLIYVKCNHCGYSVRKTLN